MVEATAPIRVAVLGAGGLGKAAAQIIGMKRELQLSAICDSHGVVVSSEGLCAQTFANLSGDLVEGFRAAEADGQVSKNGGVRTVTEAEAFHCSDPIGEILERAKNLDAILIALPNLPNEFIPDVIRRFAQETESLVFVDVLKRTRAVELLFELDPLVRQAQSVVLTGCGATPGLLTAAAVLAAQSFIEVEQINIWWGVGISNWDAYKATIREDIAHLPGYGVERAKAMTDAEIEALLNQTQGLLELRHMEHADDVLLRRVGVVDSVDQVEVGGVMDTRHPKKPVSTTMTLTGRTFEGKRSSHQFVLGDETTMAANVIGPALGYLKRGLWLKSRGLFGVFGSTEFLPMIVR
ncbi:MAG: saccharopine dehydrogenase-like oxidoreductase [Candidatus Omnitrophica bacterium]|nr:saccharopine dehydrogenase-like oxidoreductase [Candidatus Omnitrophota bacterium]